MELQELVVGQPYHVNPDEHLNYYMIPIDIGSKMIDSAAYFYTDTNNIFQGHISNSEFWKEAIPVTEEELFRRFQGNLDELKRWLTNQYSIPLIF